MDFNSVLIFLVTALGLAFYLIKKKFDYWKDRGVPSIPTKFPRGNLDGVGYTTTFGERIADHYRVLKGKGVGVGGLYFFISPNALITDLDLLRNVFVKDFNYFQDRGMYVNEEADPLTGNLFSLEGEKWKRMRNKLSPTFTTGKMKMMHSTFLQVATQFSEFLRPMAENGGSEVEVKELFARFTTDIIGNVAFGLECNSMKDPNSKFRKTGRKVFEPSSLQLVKGLIVMTFPKMALRLNLRVIESDITNFFMDTVRQTMDYREKNNVQRNDFLQLLMQIKDTGKLDDESGDLGKLTFEEMVAQVFVFFLAGFETSSSTMTFATYEMAVNQDMQDRLRKEIREVLKRHDGVMNYEAAMEMTYLGQVIDETLRKYPIVTVLRRQVMKNYKVPGSDLVLEKGLIISIPVLGIHRDPAIYPRPDQFDPERFTKEELAKRHPMAYIPFGEGQRNCIGLRFGLMQTRVGLATLFNSYKVTTTEKTPIPMRFEPGSRVLCPDGGMHLKIEPVE